MRSINPYNNKTIKEYTRHSHSDLHLIIDNTYKAWLNWKQASYKYRAGIMHNAVRVLLDNKEKYAELITFEMGKVIGESITEVEKCAWVCDYYAEYSENFLRDEIIETDAKQSFVSYEPLGIVLAVMPWNFPFWQVFRFAAPALMAGNAGLLKHASNVPGCAMAIEEIFREAGLPENIFRTLLIGSNMVASVIEDKYVNAITLTGSEGAGSSVAAISGKNLKKTVLELGGSDPFVVFEDADLEETLDTALTARMINTGQSCIAAKRFIVVQDILAEFEDGIKKRMEKLQTGNPMDKSTQFGPLARMDLVDELEDQVNRSVKMGAKILLGGKRIKGKGCFFEPTILTNISADMPVFSEETFGPVLAIIMARDEEEAIRLANQSDYGLGSSLWTKDRIKGERLARKIESGAVFVNGLVKSDPRLPFGGIKKSGYGRELSHYGIKEFVNIKTIWIG